MTPKRKLLSRAALAYLGVAILLVLPVLGAPLAAPDAGTGERTVIYAMNIDKENAANLMVRFINPSSGSVQSSDSTSLKSMGHAIWSSRDEIGVSPWIGSAVLYSDKELASIARVRWTGGSARDGVTQGTFTGFSQGSTELFVPNLFVRPWMYSTMTVQNLGDDAAYFQIKYYARGSTTPFATKTNYGVPAGAHRHYDLMYPDRSTTPKKIPSFPADWAGAAVIASDNDIAAVVTTHWDQYSGVYQAVPAEEADKTVYVPSVFKRRFGDGFWYSYTGILVQNTEPSQTKVTLKLYHRTGGLAAQLQRNLDPMSAIGFNTRYWGDQPGEPLYGLGWDWLGTAVVESTNTKIAVQVNTMWPGKNTAASYNGAMPSQGTTEVFLPYMRRVVQGGAWIEYCGAIIQNLSDKTNNFDYYLYNSGGASSWNNYVLHGSNSATPWGAVGINTRYSANLASLGGNWRGTMYVKAQHNVGVIVNCVRSDSSFTYNGINQ